MEADADGEALFLVSLDDLDVILCSFVVLLDFDIDFSFSFPSIAFPSPSVDGDCPCLKSLVPLLVLKNFLYKFSLVFGFVLCGESILDEDDELVDWLSLCIVTGKGSSLFSKTVKFHYQKLQHQLFL